MYKDKKRKGKKWNEGKKEKGEGGRDGSGGGATCSLCSAGVWMSLASLPSPLNLRPLPGAWEYSRTQAVARSELGFCLGFCLLATFFLWIPQIPNSTICGLTQTTPHVQSVPPTLPSAKKVDNEIVQQERKKCAMCKTATPA